MLRIKTDRTVLALAYSRDGRFMASAGWKHTALHDLVTGEHVDFVQNACAYVLSLTFSFDDSHVAWICSVPGRNQIELRVGNVETRRQVKRIELVHPRGVEFNGSPRDWRVGWTEPYGLWSVQGGYLWHWNIPELTYNLNAPYWDDISGAFFTPWQSAAGNVPSIQIPDEPRTAEYYADAGTLIAQVNPNGFEVWEVGGRKPVFNQSETWVRAVAFSPDNRFLYGTGKKCISVWDTSTWSRRERFDWDISTPECIAISPDGLTAAASGYTGEIVIWDLD